MVQGIAYGILHVYNALIDDPATCRHRSRTDALLLLRQTLYVSSSRAEIVQQMLSTSSNPASVLMCYSCL